MNTAAMVAAWTILVAVAAAVPCSVLGCYLVLRRNSLLGDAISHAVLPGVAVGFLLTHELGGFGVMFGAMAVGLLTAALARAIEGLGVTEDASLGVVFTALFAIGVIVLTNAASNVDLDPGCILYGQVEYAPLDTVAILGLDVPRPLVSLVPAGLATALFVGLLWKELKLATFDPALAAAIGLRPTLLHYLLMAMVAAVTVASFEAVGSVLVVAMLIVPAAAAQLWTERLGRMIAVSALIAATSAAAGYGLAVVWDTSVAGMMAVTAGAIFATAVLFAPRHGLARRARRRVELALRIAAEDALAALYRDEEAEAGRGAARAVAGIGGPRGWLSRVGLKRSGMIEAGPDGDWQLTEVGRTRARTLVRAHRLWESYLSEHFQLPADHLHDPAERVEHFLGPGLRNELDAALRRPAADPHGRAIPPDAGPADG